jgi:hypothetical protein
MHKLYTGKLIMATDRAQILLRVDQQLAEAITQRAKSEGESINAWAGRALSTALNSPTITNALAERVTRLETTVAALLADSEGDDQAQEVIDFGRVVSFRE